MTSRPHIGITAMAQNDMRGLNIADASHMFRTVFT